MMNLIMPLIDKLIKLVEVHSLRKRQIFQDHVDPIYSDLKVIYNYYQETIKYISNMIGAADFSSEAVVTELRELRMKNMDVRKELHKYLDVLIEQRSKKDKRLSEFVSSCLAMLFCEPCSSDVVNIISRRSRLHGLVEDLAQYLEESGENISTQKLFEKAVDSLSSQLENSWNMVSNEYYKLRVECLA